MFEIDIFVAVFYRAMLHTARSCNSKFSVWNVQIPWSYRSEYFENNFTAEYLKALAHIGPNKGDLVQWEDPQN